VEGKSRSALLLASTREAVKESVAPNIEGVCDVLAVHVVGNGLDLPDREDLRARLNVGERDSYF
jgi:hypothetical protein